MVELDELNDYIWMIAWAAVFGALGGLAAYIIAGRQAAAAAMKNGDPAPEQPTTRRIVDQATGGLGSVFLGAVAAVISLYFVAPISTTVTEGAGGDRSVDRYNIVQLVALALVVGAAGETVIAAAQARVVAAVQAEKTQTTAAVAEAQIEEVGQRAIATMDRLVTGDTTEAAARTSGGAPDGLPVTHEAARQELRQQIEAAKTTIRSVAR